MTLIQCLTSRQSRIKVNISRQFDENNMNINNIPLDMRRLIVEGLEQEDMMNIRLASKSSNIEFSHWIS